MRIRSGLLGVVMFGGSLTVFATPAGACSCIGVTDAEAFDAAELVFVGELVHYGAPQPVQSSADPALWTFEVERVYKGEAARAQVVSSPVSGASCGLEIDHSGTFLVFAGTQPMFDEHRDESVVHGNLCGGTRPLGDGAVPASFGSGSPPAGAGGPALGAEQAAASGAPPRGGHPDDGSSPRDLLPVAAAYAVVALGIASIFRIRRRS
jgi:hypothetical protein